MDDVKFSFTHICEAIFKDPVNVIFSFVMPAVVFGVILLITGLGIEDDGGYAFEIVFRNTLLLNILYIIGLAMNATILLLAMKHSDIKISKRRGIPVYIIMSVIGYGYVNIMAPLVILLVTSFDIIAGIVAYISDNIISTLEDIEDNVKEDNSL